MSLDTRASAGVPAPEEQVSGAPPTSIPPASARRFRPDVDGLRAVAILLVVAFHAGVPGFDAGFIGVDVFFVISGYLITTNLLAESERTGRVGLREFWAKRIRRLVPALALVVVATLGAAWLIVGPLDLERNAHDARAATLYVSNFAFADQATDYFAEDIDSSLFLHTWSLGIEEQFYIVWPVAVLAIALVARRRLRTRSKLIAFFAVTFVMSFAWCLTRTSEAPADAFFLLPSRAWEFAAAGLLAAIPVSGVLRSRARQTAAAVAGILLLLAAMVWIDPTTLYPGAWALLPVMSTLLIIGAGGSTVASGPQPDEVNRVSRTLATAAPQWLGRVSYSWYLWHWPFILLALAYFDDEAMWVTVGAALVALPVAALVYHHYEQPVRLHPRLVASRPATFAMGILVTLFALGATVVAVQAAERQLAKLPGVPLDEVAATRDIHVCVRPVTTPEGIEYCENGDLDAETTILIVGDSHTGHWLPAFDATGRSDGVRVISRWLGRCPSLPVTVSANGEPGDTSVNTHCADFRQDTLRLIDQVRPDAVVLSNSNGYDDTMVVDGDLVDDEDERIALWGQGYQASIEELRGRGVVVGAVADNPKWEENPLDCIADEGSVAACTRTLEEAFELKDGYVAIESEVADSLAVPRLDITDVLCPDDCPMVIDGNYVYTDPGHLYRAFVLTQTDEVSAFIDRLLGGVAP